MILPTLMSSNRVMSAAVAGLAGSTAFYTMPPAASVAPGTVYIITKTDANTILGITSASVGDGSTVNGAYNVIYMYAQYACLMLVWDGISNWDVASLTDSGTYSVTFAGGFSANQAVAITYAISNNTVTLQLPSVNAVAAASPGSSTTAPLPLHLTPYGVNAGCEYHGSIILRDNAAPAPFTLVSLVTVDATGLTVIKDLSSLSSSPWTASQGMGWSFFVITYKLF